MKKNFEDFVNSIMNALQNIYPDLQIEKQEVVKSNDRILVGVRFGTPFDKSGPVVYLNDFYEEYLNGMDCLDIVGEVSESYLRTTYSQETPKSFNISWEEIKNNLSVRLISGKLNKRYLEDKPYETMGEDLALIAEYRVGNFGTVVISNGLSEGKSSKEIIDAALKNAVNIEPPKFGSMQSMLFGGGENLIYENEIEEKESMYVLTNEHGFNGASALFYPGVKEKIRSLIGDYYILPSSIHEIICVPTETAPDVSQLRETVFSANRSVVDLGEVLSDQVYLFDGEIKIA